MVVLGIAVLKLTEAEYENRKYDVHIQSLIYQSYKVIVIKDDGAEEVIKLHKNFDKIKEAHNVTYIK